MSSLEQQEVAESESVPAWFMPDGNGGWKVQWAADDGAGCRLERLDEDGQRTGEVVAQAERAGDLALPAGEGEPDPGRFALVPSADGEAERSVAMGIGDPRAKAKLKDALKGWRKWDEKHPEVQPEDVPNGETKVVIFGHVVGVVQPRKVSANPTDTITFSRNEGLIWPGSLVQMAGIEKGGDLWSAGIKAAERAPVKVKVDALSAEPGKTVEKPDGSKVLDAIKAIVKGKPNTSPHIVFQQTEAHSSTEVALHLGVSAGYGGFKASVNVEASRKQGYNTVVVYLNERAFIASMERDGDDPDDLISEAFTEERFKSIESDGKMGPLNPPLMVSDVTYGRMLMYTFTAKATETEVTASLNASYEGFGSVSAEMKAKYKQIIRESEIKVLSKGGDPGIISLLLEGKKPSEYFSKIHTLDSYSIMGYTLRTLDGKLVKLSETHAYDKTLWHIGKTYQVGLKIDQVQWLYQGGWQEQDSIDIAIDGGEKVKNVTPSKPVTAPKDRYFAVDGAGYPFEIVAAQDTSTPWTHHFKPTEKFLSGSKDQDSEYNYLFDNKWRCRCNWTRTKPQ